ncbi:MAG: hypothetical protein WDA11_11180 [Thiohalomonadaceae bacterium]
MADDDYGHFGSGAEGYAHYVAASGEDGSGDGKNGGGGGRPPGNRGSGKIGWLIALVILVIYTLMTR